MFDFNFELGNAPPGGCSCSSDNARPELRETEAAKPTSASSWLAVRMAGKPSTRFDPGYSGLLCKRNEYALLREFLSSAE